MTAATLAPAIGVIIAWIVWIPISRVLTAGPRASADVGLFWLVMRIHARVFHRLRVEGREHIPASQFPGPMIVVANHTAGIDPLMVQSPCRFEINWLMAADMQAPGLNWLWRWGGVIAVDRRNPSGAPVRSAVRRLREGGVVGVFPEGGIERPRRQLLPFAEGVGVLIARGRCPVLPVVIDGTPEKPTAWGSLFARSRTVVRFLPTIDYTQTDLKPAEIASDLQSRFAQWTGWPVNESPDERIFD